MFGERRAGEFWARVPAGPGVNICGPGRRKAAAAAVQGFIKKQTNNRSEEENRLHYNCQ